ncbi:UPF0415 protein C7orf25 homolog [Xenia sp. Carnegie-2017]|uniref:UPF0415 protein C7orf25 homolog n=1 Tax=Xenia sp. Carnegie-2017 TaxID=2897299 RepID=UPI001F041D85|nr:UPF0415 protein C7orf25 homolog [Xenia sp. Carnegie-2017]
MQTNNELFATLTTQINEAKKFVERALAFEKLNIDGASKLSKKIKAELKFLTGLSKGHMPLKACHLNSTNLSHLGATLDVAEKLTVTNLLKPFNWYQDQDRTLGQTMSTVVVDVVTAKGWFKVVARNPNALHTAWQGEGNFGEKSIEEQAKEYLCASKQNKINFTTPQVTFVFTQGATEDLAVCLLNHGIYIQGKILPNPGCDSLLNNEIWNKNERREPAVPECQKVNLDVTAMIALVSSMTNGSCHFQFEDQILTEQAEKEREKPVLTQLNAMLQGKEMFACSLAISSFRAILETLGGPNEKERARKLLRNVTEVHDDPSTRSKELLASASIKERPKIVFGTGDKLQAITVSSNGSFVRAAKEQGIEFAVFLHEPRALTENKELYATPI